MKKVLKVLLTGGGTAGHVIPQIPLIEHIQTVNSNAKLCYVGSTNGIEKKLIQPLKIPYYSITTGKWRRYLSWCNLLMPFQLMWGILQSIKICRAFKPTVVLSKGGFVSLPVVIAAWILRIPIVVHESDVILGLANRISAPLAKLICYAFKIPLNAPAPKKAKVTGLPMRLALTQANAEKGRKMLGFNSQKPILLVWGGSLGAVSINESIYRLLPHLTHQFQVVHVCGPTKIALTVEANKGYRAFEYLDTVPLSHVLACADIVVSRAGATAIYELLFLHKPHILCPLSKKASRGEQIDNAKYVEDLGLSAVLYPEQFNDDALLKAIQNCYAALDQRKVNLAQFNLQSGTQALYQELLRVSL